MLCWMASPAAGVSRSSHALAPDGRTLRALSRNGSTTVTMPIAMAAALRRRMAARAAPRRGVAARVVRIRPRRYSAVKNIAATTTIAISPMNTPARLCSMVAAGYELAAPGAAGGQPGQVAGVVVLHPDAVAAGDHHRCVCGSLFRVLLDEDPGLGPGHK